MIVSPKVREERRGEIGRICRQLILSREMVELCESATPKQEEFLLEALDKNHLYINYGEIEDEEYGVSQEGKKLNKEFYGK